MKKGWLEKDELLFGGNLVIQRKWLDQLKGFSTDLGRRGDNLECGEDSELQIRARKQGANFYYDPELYVFQHILTKQLRPGWFITSAWYQGKANAKVYCGNERQGKSAIGYTLSKLMNSIAQAFYLAGMYLYTPFSNDKAISFRENYLVESVAPAVFELSKSWNSFLLSFKKNS